MSLQYQFDVVYAGDTFRKLISELLRACVANDLQPAMFQPLESFGQWLMVDKTRLNEAESALLTPQHTSRILQSVVFGLSDPGLAKIIRENLHLTASFVFICGCTVINAQRIGKLMHEIMQLRGGLVVAPHQVSQFVEQIKGYRDYLKGQAVPFDVYDQLASQFWLESSRQGLREDDIFHDTDDEHLAKLIFEVVGAIQDNNNEYVVLRGTRMGIWLATLFVWMRPLEVDVWVKDVRIYPTVSPSTDPTQMSGIRLSIILTSEGVKKGEWQVESWRKVEGKLGSEVIVKIDASSAHEVAKQHASPLATTKLHIAGYLPSDESVESVGYLAAALVIFAVEQGTLGFPEGSCERQVISLCSESFLQSYPNALSWFGWDNLEQKRVDKIIGSFNECLDSLPRLVESFPTTMPDTKRLTLVIRHAAKNYHDFHGENMINEDEEYLDDIISFGIHIATEALFFSLCRDRPRCVTYRPLEQNVFARNADILYTMAFMSPVAGKTVKRMLRFQCPYWHFRSEAMKAVISTTESIYPSWLAFCSDGYVVYQSVLHCEGGDSATDMRLAASFSVIPGTLRTQGVQGIYRRLIEQEERSLLATRTVGTSIDSITLFSMDGTFQGIDEADAVDKHHFHVRHLIKSSDHAVGTLYIVTYLQQRGAGDSTTQRRVPASWQNSISAVIFATHIEKSTVRLKQIELLAKEWTQAGTGQNSLQWNFVGRDAVDQIRSITTTRGQESLRFFEAGNLGFKGRPVYFRRETVPLINCMKEAMEREKFGWIIIA